MLAVMVQQYVRVDALQFFRGGGGDIDFLILSEVAPLGFSVEPGFYVTGVQVELVSFQQQSTFLGTAEGDADRLCLSEGSSGLVQYFTGFRV